MHTGELTSLDEGINLFNHGEYFKAHEEWESEWRLMQSGVKKDFLQGLILIAGSFIHYVRHECAGALELLERGIVKLRSGIEDNPDISVAEFVGRLERLRDAFAECSFPVPLQDLPLIRRNLVNW